MAIAERYAQAAWDDSALLATWTPDRLLAVGDVITHVPGGTVRVERKLAELVEDKLPQITATDAATSTLLQSGVTVEATADAKLPVGLARIALTGSRSFLFVGGRAQLSSFATVAPLRHQMTAMSALWRWETDWHLVIAVRQYDAGTVVIAESDDVRAEIRVEGPAAVTSLAGITAGGRISVTAGRAATYTMGRCTPFYEALRVRRRLTGSRVDPSTLNGQPPASAVLDDIDAAEVVRVMVDDIGLLV